MLRLQRLLALPKGKFARGAAAIALGTVGGQAFGFLVSPIITRLYTPEQFGTLGVYVSLVAIIAALGTLRLELAIPVAKSEQEAFEITVLALLSSLVSAVVTALAFLFFGSSIVQLLNKPALLQYFGLISVAVFVSGIILTLNSWALRNQQFTHISRMKLSQGIGGPLVQLVCGYFSLGSWGLVLGDLAGRTAGSGALLVQVWQTSRAFMSEVSWRGLQRVFSVYRRFPLFVGPSTVINALGVQMPTLLLTSFYGGHVAGFWVLGQRIVGGGLSLISQSIAQAYFSKVASLASGSPLEHRRVFWEVIFRLSVFICPTLLVFGWFAPDIFRVAFGEEWLTAGQFMQLQVPALIASFIALPVSYSLNVFERQDVQFAWDVARLLVVLGTFLFANRYGLSPHDAILYFSVVSCLMYLTLIGLVYYFTIYLPIRGDK